MTEPKPTCDAGEERPKIIDPKAVLRQTAKTYDDCSMFDIPAPAGEFVRLRDALTAALRTDPDVARVLAERVRQDEKWGVQDHDDPAWLMILAEEVGEVAELVVKVMQPGDPYRPVADALIHWGVTAQALIQDACELGTRQAVNTSGVEHEMEQSTAVGLAWLQCMTRRREAAVTPNAPSDATDAASPRQGLEEKG